MAQKSDSLKPGQEESFELGMAELESLLKQAENQKQIPREARAKQGQVIRDVRGGNLQHEVFDHQGLDLFLQSVGVFHAKKSPHQLLVLSL